MLFDPYALRPELLIPLVAGHFIGDFLLQTAWMVRGKDKTWIVALHAGVVAFWSWVLTGHFQSWWWLIPILLVPHFFVDLAKSAGTRAIVATGPRRSNLEATLFLLDQSVHLLFLLGLAMVLPAVPFLRDGVSGSGFWLEWFGGDYLKVLVLVSGWIVVAPATGFFLAHLLSRFEEELSADQKEGLQGGGYWIGITERSLIYLFILVGEHSGIGFLAAAKAIFRIGELQKKENRTLAEYILIGTLMSFALAMVVGLASKGALTRLQ